MNYVTGWAIVVLWAGRMVTRGLILSRLISSARGEEVRRLSTGKVWGFAVVKSETSSTAMCIQFSVIGG
jgi:hypothetical protein